MSETVTMTLTEFLLARIAEDEDRARDIAWDWLAEFWPHVQDDADWEVTMVEGWLRPAAEDTPPAYRQFTGPHAQDVPWFAAHYADHPAYREDWRP